MGRHSRSWTEIKGIETDCIASDEKYCQYRIAAEGCPLLTSLIGVEITQEVPLTLRGEESGFQFGEPATWQIVEQISAGTNCSENWLTNIPGVFEATGVFVCRKLSGGPNLGEEAILKVFAQLPPLDQTTAKVDYGFVPNPEHPEYDVASCFWKEASALCTLTKAKCPFTPAIYYWLHAKQEDHDPLPHGYWKCVLMEKAPGTNLNDFWQRPLAEREMIREAFRIGYPQVRMHYTLMDRALRNLIWDKQGQRIYFIDFEDTVAVDEDGIQYEDEGPVRMNVLDVELAQWGLLGFSGGNNFRL